MNRKSSYLNIEFLSACTEAKLYPEDFGHEVAICGRSNSGKSSIINALANSKKLAKTSNRLDCHVGIDRLEQKTQQSDNLRKGSKHDRKRLGI